MPELEEHENNVAVDYLAEAWVLLYLVQYQKNPIETKPQHDQHFYPSQQLTSQDF